VRDVLKFIEGQPTFNIVDVLKDLEQAELAGVLATPTLIREEPLPSRVLVGDLSNLKMVISALNLVSEGSKITL
jgi:circadian clock protein KaiB